LSAVPSGRLLVPFLLLLLCLPRVPVPAQTSPPLEDPLGAADEILAGDNLQSGQGAEELLPPEVSMSVTSRITGERKEFPAGEPFEFVIELRVEGGGSPGRLGPIPELAFSSNLEWIDTAIGNRRMEERGGVTEIHLIRYTLVGNAPGDGSIRPANVEYFVPGEETPRSLPVPAVSVSIGPAPAGGPALWHILLVVVGIPAAVLAVVGAFLYSRKRKAARDAGEGKAEEPVWKRELDEARRKRFEGDPRAYLRDLSDVLRRGMAERCGLEGSNDVRKLEARIEEETAEDSKLREAVRLLEELNTARYAPETPPLEDLDRTAKRIEELLENDRDPSRD